MHPGRIVAYIAPAIGLISLVVACGDSPPPRDLYAVQSGSGVKARASTPCRQQNPLRDAFFGDIHVHTSSSTDAWMFGVRVTPDDALRYAFGGSLDLPVEGENKRAGPTTRRVSLDRPLDFVAITDHAEFLGEQSLCTDPELTPDIDLCQSIRDGRGRSVWLVAQLMWPFTFRYDSLCGEDGELCRKQARTMWQKNIEAAEQWNDESEDCERTAFIAYEYSSYRLGSNLHRNVIFKNNAVMPLPVSYIEAPREWQLWDMLKTGCIDSGTGCDVIAVPHNSNLSNGRMFNVDYIDADSDQERRARNALRMEIEPIVEIMQHKGDSECRVGVPGVLGAEDELCGFEKFDEMVNMLRSGESAPNVQPEECLDGKLGDWAFRLGPSCVSHLSFARYALVEGLRQEAELGVNPFKFGLSAATDTHNGLAGGVEERSYPGHLGIGDDTVEDRVAWSGEVEGNVTNNPGGLIGVWAEQNNRDAIFESMQRKEVFGTSGPRIKPRLFGGWNFDPDLCLRPDVVALADGDGVPMGGDLPLQEAGTSAPVFVAMASADAGTVQAPGTLLQRLQIIKGWVDDDGALNNKVFDIAGDPDNDASVDVNTCKTSGSGFKQLCTVWQDPEFNPRHRAVYYMRVVENPSCRYNAWQCTTLAGADRPAGCDDPHSPKVIQERAWTSPIWYSPPANQSAGGLREPST